ncbi:hypothetical protein J7E71_12895 [Mesobacillus foraminis]|uniref:hypothetical protein n=1 Tax=Mesobacillus foraminis TaxID=279826 RepID=UPI001BEA257D|nr:hypothetical protein [Mesobacillus foraminis]MBT2756845.1 hypothetical protein [Mesobacillus foraminis]
MRERKPGSTGAIARSKSAGDFKVVIFLFVPQGQTKKPLPIASDLDGDTQGKWLCPNQTIQAD